MTPDFNSGIRRFEEALASSRPEAWSLLKTTKPVADVAFSQFNDAFGYSLPQDLVQLYRAHDGYWPNDYDESKQIVPNWFLLPFADALKQYDRSPFGRTHDRSEWPLLSDQSGEVVFRIVTQASSDDEKLYIRSLEAGLDGWSIFDGISQMLATFTNWIEEGVLENESAKTQLALRYNPLSRYWQHAAQLYGVHQQNG